MPELMSVGLDPHRRIGEFLQWRDNSRLACCCVAMRDALSKGRYPLWWGQAQSTSREVNGLLSSFCRAIQTLSPAARPNFAMLMIDTAVLLKTKTAVLCRRLHAAGLVPMECPILVIDSSDGVFGATAAPGEEGNFSQYEGRDIELDPVAPIIAVLTVAYVPPEDMSVGAGSAIAGQGARVTTRPRVSCFLADGQAQSPPYASASFVDDWEELPPVWMESVLPREEMMPSRHGVGPCSKSCSGTAGRANILGWRCGIGRMDRNVEAVKSCCSIHTGDDACAGAGCGKLRGRRAKSPRTRSADRAGESSPSLATDTQAHYGSNPGRVKERENGGGSGDGRDGAVSDSVLTFFTSSDVGKPYACGVDGVDTAGKHLPMTVQQRIVGKCPRYTPRLSGGSRGGSRGGSSRCRPGACLPKLKPPSSSVPLEDADTILLVGTHLDMLDKTSAWLGNALPNAVIMGGLSNCALVIGDEVYCRSALRRRSPFGTVKPLVVGLALRGVRALAVSAKGFCGVGPVFRVDSTIDGPSGNPQARPGKILREVTVVAEGGCTRPSTAGAIFYDEVLNSPAWNANPTHGRQTVFLGVGWSPDELFCSRVASGSQLHNHPVRAGCYDGDGRERAKRAEEATGLPPVSVNSVMGQLISLQDDVVPGQYARYMRTQAELSLADTETAYLSCRQRMEREGGVALSSIHFTCAARPDRLEAIYRPTHQQQEHGNSDNAEEAPVFRVMALHQQEVVRFCSTMNAPAAGIFCQGELGPLPTLVGGILPNASRSRLQAFSTCTAVLYWNPGPAETGDGFWIRGMGVL